MSRASFEKMLRDNPKFHAVPGGGFISWAVSPQVLEFIYQNVEPGMVTLETGAGQTTVTFAIAGARHTCITPAALEAEMIAQYCAELGLESAIQFLVDSSDKILAKGDAIPAELDFVLIDGAHRFPFPCLDWHFTESRLKVGGIMAVDDAAMPSVKILLDFLSGEEEWDLIERIGDTAFFRRTKPTQVVSDWMGQKFNLRWYEELTRGQQG